KFDENKYHKTTEGGEQFLKAYIVEDVMSEPKKLRHPTISPLYYKDTKQPDTLIVAATHDILIDGINAYEEKLKKQGTYVETYYDQEM
ncbi:pimeloyl-ACP methyl ester esterase BioJ, partial [Francisella tularensis subsp. holarctica]|nr:pimeloyl-ACP methyl ester esterase BioJ [Francisella tularensis subsp. holarctica]